MTTEESIMHSFDWRLAVALGGVEKAVLIGNIQYWICENERQKKATHFHKGEYWTYWTAEELAAKYPYMKAPSIYRWLRELKADGWVKTDVFNDTWQERKTWYGRTDRLIAWFNAPIYQNDKWSNYQTDKSSYQTDKSNYQNDKRDYQNDNSTYQNDNTIYQNDNCIYKDTHNTSQNTAQDTTHKIVVVDAQNADSDFQKKIGGGGAQNPTPNPLPPGGPAKKPENVPINGSEFRVAIQTNRLALEHAQRIKLATDQATYHELIEAFLSYQANKQESENPEIDSVEKVIFVSLAKAKMHFMHWMNDRELRAATSPNKSSNGNQRSNQRGTSNLRPTSLGQSEYRGTGSTCDVEV